MAGPSLNTHNLPHKPNTPATIKFLCSYGGKILPRYPDGKLRYHGGDTRLLSVHRSIPFSELMVKVGELCGTPVSLRCQLPTEDLDALVSITSDEDLANLIEEYDRTPSLRSSIKIRAFLSLPKASRKLSPPSSTTAIFSPDAASPKSPLSSSSSSSSSTSAVASTSRTPATGRCLHKIPPPVAFPMCYEKSAGKPPHCAFHARRNPSHIYLIHNGNHWQ